MYTDVDICGYVCTVYLMYILHHFLMFVYIHIYIFTHIYVFSKAPTICLPRCVLSCLAVKKYSKNTRTDGWAQIFISMIMKYFHMFI